MALTRLPLSLRTAAPLCLLLGALALAPAAQDADFERAERLAELAQNLVGAGEGFQAIALLESELSAENSPKAQAYLLFTIARFEHQLADQDETTRAARLEAAARRYREGLAVEPESPRGKAGLALVEGDLLLEREDLSGAVTAWWRALDADPSDDTAGRRILANLEGDAGALASQAMAFEARGRTALARDAWERVIAATPEESAAEPLLAWLLLETELGDFSPTSVAELEGGGAAKAELALFVKEPLRAQPPSWAASPLAKHALAGVLRSLGGWRGLEGDAAGALALYERAVEIAPDPPVAGRPPAKLHAMLDVATRLRANPELDPTAERLEALGDLLIDASAGALISDIEGRQRYYEVVGQILADRGEWTAPPPNNAIHLLKLAIELQREIDGTTAIDEKHPLPHLSALLADGLLVTSDPRGSLEAHLDAASGYIDLKAYAAAEKELLQAQVLASSLGKPPRLTRIAERLQRETGRGLEAGYQQQTPPPAPKAEEPAPKAATPPALPEPAQAEPAQAEPEAAQFTPAEVPAPRDAGGASSDGIFHRLFAFDGDRFRAPLAAGAWSDRWYAGAGYGSVVMRNDEGDIEDDIGDPDVTVELDRRDGGYHFYAGYRLDWPLAFELGYANLGKISSEVGPEPPTNLDEFLEEIADEHPATGAGPSLAMRFLLFGTDTLAASARIGAWAWESDVEIKTATAKVSAERDGVDLFYGLGVAWYPFEWGGARLDYERYELDDADVDLVTVGIEIELDTLLNGS